MNLGVTRKDKEEVAVLQRIEGLLERIAFQLEELNRKTDEIAADSAVQVTANVP